MRPRQGGRLGGVQTTAVEEQARACRGADAVKLRMPVDVTYASGTKGDRDANATELRMSEGHVGKVGHIGREGHMMGTDLTEVKGHAMPGDRVGHVDAADADLDGTVEEVVAAAKANGTAGHLPTPRLATWDLGCDLQRRRRSAELDRLRTIAMFADVGWTREVVMAMLYKVWMPLQINGEESRKWERRALYGWIRHAGCTSRTWASGRATTFWRGGGTSRAACTAAATWGTIPSLPR